MESRRLTAVFVWVWLAVACPLMADGPAATVNGVALEQWEVKRELSGLITGGSYHRRVSPERRAELERQALDLLIEKEVKLQWAQRTGLVVDVEPAEQALNKVRARFASTQAYLAALRQMGIAEDDFRRVFVRDTISTAVDSLVMAAEPAPTDAEIEEYFLSHEQEFRRPETRRVVHMFFPVPPSASSAEWERAELEAAKIGERVRNHQIELSAAVAGTLDDLAPKYRDQVGDLGFVHRGALQPEVDEQVFAAEIGEVRGPIRTIYGFHLFQVLEVGVPGLLSLSQVHDAIEQLVHEERMSKALTAFEKAERAAAEIEIFDWSGEP